MTTDHRKGKCCWCGADGEVFKDNGLCDDCDSQTIHCGICRCRQGSDNHCRHVFQDRWFEWSGAGVGYATDATKRAFMELLTLMPDGFAADLREAVGGGKFHTWIVAPLIGGGGTLELHGMPARDGRSMFHAWGDEMIALGQRDDAEKTADGYHWLASLFERKTRAANKWTVEWIDEWLSEQVPRAGAWFWHQPANQGAAAKERHR